jgi:hypothetical protein
MLDERGVCRPTIPSAGRATFGRAAAVLFGAASGRIAFRFSRSGDCLVTREALLDSARLVESIFLFRGSTAPVVGVDFGARPFFGLVLACLCFLPSRFLSSLLATDVQLSLAHLRGGQVSYAIYSLSSLL